MKAHGPDNSGLSLLDVLIIVATIAVVAAVFLPRLARSRARTKKIGCVNCLKQVGLAYRIWSNDQTERLAFAVSTNSGGTLEFANSPDVFRHFVAMSNQLNSPRILVCPNDRERRIPKPNANGVLGFENLSNSNVSYFVGFDADESKPERLLSGDRNITGGRLSNGFLRVLQTNSAAGWAATIHTNVGNIGLADGSAQQTTPQMLQSQLKLQTFNTIRLAIP